MANDAYSVAVGGNLYAGGVVGSPPPAPSFTLTGPSSASAGVSQNYTLTGNNLAAGQDYIGSLVSGDTGMVDTPSQVTLNTTSPSAVIGVLFATVGTQTLKGLMASGTESNQLSVTVSGSPPPPAPTTATLSGSNSATAGVAHTSTVTLNAAADQAYTVTWTRSDGGSGPATSTINIGQTSVNASTTWAAAGTARTVDFTISPSLTRAGRPLTVDVAGAPPATGNLANVALASTGTGTRPYSATIKLRPGQLPAGSILVSPDDATLRGFVMSTHADGSACIVIVSGTTSLGSAASGTVRVQAGSPSGTNLTAAAISAQVTSVDVNLQSYGTATITDFSAPERVWWATPGVICARYRVAAPTPGSTALEAVIDIHAYADRALVEVVVENGRMSSSSPVKPAAATYTGATVSVNGTVVATVNSTGPASAEGDHAAFRAWYAKAWVGAGDPGVRANQVVAELQQDPTLPDIEQASTANLTVYASDAYTPWDTGRMRPTGMGAGGDHPSIGPLTQWDARWLQTGNADVAKAVEENGLAALSYNIGYRDAATGRVPAFSAVGTRSQSGGTWPNQTNGNDAAMWETAHHPAVGFIAFLARPSPVFIEVAQKVAFWNGTYSASSNGSFTWSPGVFGHWYQVRGKAWGVRSLTHALALTPSTDTTIRTDLAYALQRNAELVDTWRTDAKQKLGSMWNYSPTSLNDHATNSPHFQFAHFEQFYLIGEMVKCARSGLLGGAQQTTFASVAAWCAELPCRWVNERANGGWRYVPYSVALGPSKTTINSPDTWGQQMASFMTDSPPSVSGPWRSFANNVANSYAAFTDDTAAGALYPSYLWAALVAAVEIGATGAEQAWSTVQANITNLSTWLAGFGNDPRWGCVPRVSYWGTGAATGSIAGNLWTPGRDANGLVNRASWDTLEVGTMRVYEVASTRLDGLDAAVKAQMLSTFGDTWTDVGVQGWGGVTNAWVGWVPDVRAGSERFWIGPGGGHAASGNNGMYRFEVRKMGWFIAALPTPRSAYPPTGYQGDTNYPLTAGNFTAGPQGIWYDEIYDPANPTSPTRSSRDPSSRHTYNMQAFVPSLGAQGTIVMMCRRAWRFDVATGTWSLPRSYLNGAAEALYAGQANGLTEAQTAGQNGNNPQNYASAENGFVWYDEVADRVYHCGNNASASSDNRNFWWSASDPTRFGTSGYYPAGGWPASSSAFEKRGRIIHHLQYQHQNAGSYPDNRPSKPVFIRRHNLDTSSATTLNITFSGALASASWPLDDQVGYWDVGTVTFVEPLNRYLINIRRATGSPSTAGDEWAWVDATTGVCTLATDLTGAVLAPFMQEGRVRYMETIGAVVFGAPATENLRVMRVINV